MKPKSFVKVGLSVLMLVLIARSVNFDLLKTTFQSIPLSTALVVVVVYTLGQVLSSIKWYCIVRAGGIDVSYPTALKAYFIGMFVNCFGFGMVGGDVARGVLVAHGLPKKTQGVASVVADRVHGLTVLSMIALSTSLLLGHPHVSSEFVAGLALLCAGFIAVWVLGPWILTNVAIVRRLPFAAKLEQVAAVFPRDARTLTIISVLSVVFHTIQILLHVAMARGVGATIPWAVLFVVIPFVNIAASLPISWQGLGVREKSYIFFLTPPGIVSLEQAVAFGAMWLLAVTVTSALGGLVALFSGDLKTLNTERLQAGMLGGGPVGADVSAKAVG